VTLWSIRLACVAYVCALAFLITGARERFRIVWTAGLLLSAVHIAAAFAFHHNWSHENAWEDTARQTAELFGFYWGGGLYFNYLFAVVWTIDVGWLWLDRDSYLSRPRFVAVAIHSFLAFMFFNGTVVFGSGWTRWSGIAATIGLVLLWWLKPWRDR
jgi:hypothetical protein